MHGPGFDPAGFLDGVVDQIAARDGLAGVYIVIAQNAAGHPFESTRYVQRAYLELCRSFAGAGLGVVLTNFADVFALACMAAGATGAITGYSRSQRRLSLVPPAGGSGAFPAMYSHRAAAEFTTQRDLGALVRHRMVRRLRDVTQFSQSLFAAIDAGRTAAEVPEWAESRGNVDAANRHFVARIAAETAALAGLDHQQRRERVRDWLEGAETTQVFLTTRLGQINVPGRLAAASVWLEIAGAD